MTTERLYYTDARLTSFEAQVVERSADGRRIHLNRTAFYPASGGQPHDTGTLAGAPVIDVVDEGERIAHLLDAPFDGAVGDQVHGEVAWARRFDHMQQHTGQHLLSALFADLHGHATVSVHFGPEVSTLDLDCERVSDDVLAAVELRANELIAEARQVSVSFEDPATVTGLRKAPPREGVLRVVTIDGVDRSACGGTHVATTAEIGVTLLRGQEKVRKSARIAFVCGLRALHRARRDHDALQHVARSLGTSPDDAPRLVEAQREQVRELQSTQRRLQGALDAYRARERYEAATADASGVRWLRERTTSGSPDAWRDFALAWSTLPRAAFLGASESPPSILLAVSADAGIDAGQTLRRALEQAGGRGGGSPRMAQGSLPSRESLDEALRLIDAGPGAGARGQ
jgi:alanyl-tRNA synthetase